MYMLELRVTFPVYLYFVRIWQNAVSNFDYVRAILSLAVAAVS